MPGPDGDAARGMVNWALGRAEFRGLSIRNLEVRFNAHTSPPSAETKFTVYVRGRARGAEYADLGEIERPVNMEVQLRKQSGRWLIYGEPRHDVRE